LTETPLLLATTNPGKAREIRKFLTGLPFKFVPLAEALPGLSHRERGGTFLEIARAKSLFYSRKWRGLVLAEDSGLEVDALGREPGVRSARYSTPHPTDARNNAKLLRRLLGLPAPQRGARFVCVMVLSERGRVLGEFRGEVRGRILNEPRGRNGFGYDPLFHYPALGKTFAEIGRAEKLGVSHRGRALRKVKRYLLARRPGAKRPVRKG